MVRVAQAALNFDIRGRRGWCDNLYWRTENPARNSGTTRVSREGKCRRGTARVFSLGKREESESLGQDGGRAGERAWGPVKAPHPSHQHKWRTSCEPATAGMVGWGTRSGHPWNCFPNPSSSLFGDGKNDRQSFRPWPLPVSVEERQPGAPA
ncbi:hypothetical protein VTI74DRAFT_1505 [Chaetomium olivicolor]